MPGTAVGDDHEQTLLLDHSRVERWAVADGSRGGRLNQRNARAMIGLASGDQTLGEHCLGLLERRGEDLPAAVPTRAKAWPS